MEKVIDRMVKKTETCCLYLKVKEMTLLGYAVELYKIAKNFDNEHIQDMVLNAAAYMKKAAKE